MPVAILPVEGAGVDNFAGSMHVPRLKPGQEKAEPPSRVLAINNAHGHEPTYRETACLCAQLRSGPRPRGPPPVSALLGIRNGIREAKGLCKSMTVLRATVVRQRPVFRA